MAFRWLKQWHNLICVTAPVLFWRAPSGALCLSYLPIPISGFQCCLSFCFSIHCYLQVSEKEARALGNLTCITVPLRLLNCRPWANVWHSVEAALRLLLGLCASHMRVPDSGAGCSWPCAIWKAAGAGSSAWATANPCGMPGSPVPAPHCKSLGTFLKF